jgi:hypothetical protein
MLAAQLGKYRQMALVAGPRQVGKTTISRQLASDRTYLSWDDPDHRRLSGTASIGPRWTIRVSGWRRSSLATC